MPGTDLHLTSPPRTPSLAPRHTPASDASWTRRFLGNFLVLGGVTLLFFSGALTVYADPWGLRAPSGGPTLEEARVVAAGLAGLPEEPPPAAGGASVAASPAPGRSQPSHAAPPNQPPSAIYIPSIEVATRVTPVESMVAESQDGTLLKRWQTASYAAGYHRGSASPGAPGNTVISGHNNVLGAVFRRLEAVERGDTVLVTAQDGRAYPYVVTEKVIVQEEGVPLETRRQNAAYMAPSRDHRLTLISCWPYWTNTHRVIVTAKLVQLPQQRGTPGILATAPPAAIQPEPPPGGPPRDEILALRRAAKGPPREETLAPPARQWAPREVRPALSTWERLDQRITQRLLPAAYLLAALTGTIAAAWRVVLTGGLVLWAGLASGLAVLVLASLELTYREASQS